MKIKHPVFIDESSIDTGMIRLYGRAGSNERVIDCTPDTRGERISVLSSLRTGGNAVPLLFKGTLDGELFKEYIVQCLAPVLKPGDMVVMDSLSSHKVAGVMEPVIAVGASVLYLPPYSPDLDPIEMMWFKKKAYLRKMKARTEELPGTAIAEALSRISISDSLGWDAEDGNSTQ